MGFFNLQLTVSMYASTADISTTTRPSFACPSVPATYHQGLVDTKTVQRVLPEWTSIGRVGTKKGAPKTLLSSGLGL